jgi:hypothetical protein
MQEKLLGLRMQSPTGDALATCDAVRSYCGAG